MPENDHATPVLDPVFQPVLEFWTKCIEQSQEQTQAFMQTLRDGADLKSLRRRWLDSIAQSLDAFMRSPPFLQAMRGNVDALSEFKANAEEAAQEVARETGIPRMNDISGLFERVRLGQDLILARLDGIERRLDAMEKPGRKGNS